MKKLLHILFSILILALFSCDNGKIDKKSTQNLSDSLNIVYSWTLNDTIRSEERRVGKECSS